MYYRRIAAPDDARLLMIREAASLVSIVVEQRRSEAELRRYREQLEQLVDQRLPGNHAGYSHESFIRIAPGCEKGDEGPEPAHGVCPR